MQFVGTFWALVPPIIAITLALITKEAYSSLFIGVVIGALFACGFAPVATIDMIVNDGIIAAIADNAGIFLFLVLLGIIVALVNLAGGSAAFGRWAEKNIHTRVGAQLATFILGILIFIDDYFNCLTVGSVMRPVTDRHQISRPKLAYLIDATAAPVCMIAPISSWAAAVSSTAEDLDTGISGIQLFIRAIPYNFYSLLTFVFIITLTLLKFDYGPMRGFEERARSTGDLSAAPGSTEENANPKGRVIDLVIPVIMLIILCTIGMLYVGGFFGADTSGWHRLRRRLHRCVRQHGCVRRPPVGRHHRAGAHGHLPRRPPRRRLPRGYGLHPQGLSGHDLPDHHPDTGRLPQDHAQRAGCRRLCARSDVRCL